MRKEIIWVAGIGILLGIIIAFGVWRVNSSISNNTPPPTINESPTPTSSPIGFDITLSQPQDNDVITSSPMTVSGITKPLSWIVISGESSDYVLQSNADGTFSQEVDLTPGVNQIQATTFSPEGDQTQAKVIVVYSYIFPQETAVATPTTSPNATDEVQINQKVAQRLAQISSQPKAYLGSVTDIADSTIEIKSLDSKIQQISVEGSGITVVDTRGHSTKPFKPTDIAIGDFIIAMGYVDSSHVLSARQISISNSFTENKISYSLAKITKITKSSLTVTNVSDGSTTTLQPDKDTDIEIISSGKSKSAKLSDLNVGDEVIYVVGTTAGELIPRSIFDIAPLSPTLTPKP
jgi:hypothetical protein